MKIPSIELKVGNAVLHNDKLYYVIDTQHVKPGKGGAFMQIELKGIDHGTKLNHRFRSDEMVEKVILDEIKMQFLYTSENKMEVMNMQNFEQISIDLNLLTGDKAFLEPDMILRVLFANEKIISVDLPESVVLTVVTTEPYIKGQTVKSGFKPAIMNNEITVHVPTYMSVDEKIVVSTKTKEFLEKYKGN